MAESGIESPAAPEWLVKLENRREQIKATKLSHESGNGAPCKTCGSACPGLDLHFWRKICRNCKCRKEQHDCIDDDVSGWAQFEILGAIRSKPAYIRISELTDKPVQLTWVPPNVTPELATDYMRTLGEQNIPIVGSEAAEKRKQQLEYQVPAHDLDTNLCHNLTPYEAGQLSDYVEKIKAHCVGQGTVVRVGGDNGGLLQYGTIVQQNDQQQPKQSTSGSVTNGNESEAGRRPDFMESPILSDKMKYKLNLMGIVSSEAVQQAMRYDPAVVLSAAGLAQYPEPIVKFHREYQTNPKFRAEMDRFVESAGHSPQVAGTVGQSIPGTAGTGPMVPSGSNDSGFASIPVSPAQDDDQSAAGRRLIGAMEAMQIAPSTAPTKQQAALIGNEAIGVTVATQCCTGCTLPIKAGDVAVKVDRASNTEHAIWHPQCFKCESCGELLADLVYFYHAGGLYCGRDLAAILKIPRCAACDELIFTKEYTAAEGATFHVRHFCCYHCDGPLAGQQYVMDERSAQPLCLPCYEAHYAQTCSTCGRCIGPTEQGVGWDKIHWHKECFRCSGKHCQKSLIGGRFCVKANRPYCSAQCTKDI
ncbi:testin [Anopheles darlingi]|uniref:Testin n=1 Tax=Anopheles darlingi TaxID=43151 RepID=W5JLZ4_ANODA|nr:testin [Anopheles darlingi]